MEHRARLVWLSKEFLKEDRRHQEERKKMIPHMLADEIDKTSDEKNLAKPTVHTAYDPEQGRVTILPSPPHNEEYSSLIPNCESLYNAP